MAMRQLIFVTSLIGASVIFNTKAFANPDCWVKLYVHEDLDALAANDTIMGPGEWPTMLNMPNAARLDWSDSVNSLQMGPKARGYFWEDANFLDDMIEFGPGRAINRLDEYNFGDEIDSMKIECLL